MQAITMFPKDTSQWQAAMLLEDGRVLLWSHQGAHRVLRDQAEAEKLVGTLRTYDEAEGGPRRPHVTLPRRQDIVNIDRTVAASLHAYGPHHDLAEPPGATPPSAPAAAARRSDARSLDPPRDVAGNVRRSKAAEAARARRARAKAEAGETPAPRARGRSR